MKKRKNLKYMYFLRFEDGEVINSTQAKAPGEAGVFPTYEEAERAAIENINNIRSGAAMFSVINPGDPRDDPNQKIEYKVVGFEPDD